MSLSFWCWHLSRNFKLEFSLEYGIIVILLSISFTKFLNRCKVWAYKFGCTCKQLISNGIANSKFYDDFVNRAQKLRYDTVLLINLFLKSYQCNTVIKSLNTVFNGMNIDFVIKLKPYYILLLYKHMLFHGTTIYIYWHCKRSSFSLTIKEVFKLRVLLDLDWRAFIVLRDEGWINALACPVCDVVWCSAAFYRSDVLNLLWLILIVSSYGVLLVLRHCPR